MDVEQTRRWTDVLRQAGHHPGAVLGAGMEGTVIDLGNDLVAKIWHRRTASDVSALKTFYDAVAAADAPFRTPDIHRILNLEGQVATVEARLTGQPLRTDSEDSEPSLDDVAAAAVTDVLAGLAAIDPTPGMGILPILEGEAPFDTETTPFAHNLATLVERRSALFRKPQSARLPRVGAIAIAVIDSLGRLDAGTRCLVHGDLIPANILVDAAMRPQAVLDFGFMTTIGDPAFDAAITASIYDMYGPRAAVHEALLDAAISDRFGYPPHRLAVYRAAYALITSNCFSASGSEGHFEWCMRMLERPDLHDALGL